MTFWRKLSWPRRIVFIVVAAVVAIQLIPVWLVQTNPPVLAEPNWDSPETRALAKRACFDCHSNETVWPWYSKVAPVSWLITKDTLDGRQNLNFSEWGRGRRVELDEVEEVLREGQMPLPVYLPMHPEANLSQAEREQLIAGLLQSLK
ncbi:MAG: heme-binding domain-containing protein [Anaerolineales bacterium]|nr:heme-binding domain-containing protein [Anaerolineales bacterium]